MKTSSWKLSNNSGIFYCFCDGYNAAVNRLERYDLVKTFYLVHCLVILGDDNKLWAPRLVYKSCKKRLEQPWIKSLQKDLTSCVQTVWMRHRNHYDDCTLALSISNR